MIVRRTFEAKRHPAGSAERARLNLEPETSEYMTSYRYVVRTPGKAGYLTCRSKSEAEARDAS